MAPARAQVASLLPDEKPRTRPVELEDGLNRFVYHPLAASLAGMLRPLGVSPNAVSVSGMLLIFAATWAYVGLAWPLNVLIGLAFHLSWHVVDGADGDLARLTGKASQTGELIDGACDYVGHIVLYVALATVLDDWIGFWAWLVVAAAGASRVAQSVHIESHRRAYLWRVYGVPWFRQGAAAGDRLFRAGSRAARLFGWLPRLYLFLSGLMAPTTAAVDAQIEAAAADPLRRAAIRRLARRASRRSLLLQKLIGPNQRTILLGVSMLVGSPLYFFLLEAVPLNLVLAASIGHDNRAERRLAEKLRQLRHADG